MKSVVNFMTIESNEKHKESLNKERELKMSHADLENSKLNKIIPFIFIEIRSLVYNRSSR
jgi:hypothetical protein